MISLLVKLLYSTESQQKKKKKKIPDTTPSKNIVLLGSILPWRKHLAPSQTPSILFCRHLEVVIYIHRNSGHEMYFLKYSQAKHGETDAQTGLNSPGPLLWASCSDVLTKMSTDWLPWLSKEVKSFKWSRSVVSDSFQPHGLEPTRLLHPWNFPGKSTGVGCHFLLQRIFPTQGSNLVLPHCGQVLYHLSHQLNKIPAGGLISRWTPENGKTTSQCRVGWGIFQIKFNVLMTTTIKNWNHLRHHKSPRDDKNYFQIDWNGINGGQFLLHKTFFPQVFKEITILY